MSANYIDDLAEDIHQEAHGHVSIASADLPLYRLYAVLGLAKGSNVTREDVHDAWAAWKAGIDPGHRSLKPWDELAESVRALDQPYADAINLVMLRRETGR